MSTEIARRTMSIDDLQRVAKAHALSGYFEDARDVAQAFVKVQFGNELGLPPLIAMSEIHVIKGKPTLGAGALAPLVKAHPAYDYRVVKHDEDECVLEFYAVDGQERAVLGESRFTMDDAKRAELTSSSMYRKYPRNMLFARAISNGVGWYCPDVTMGRVYTPEELVDEPPARAEFDVQAAAVEAPEIAEAVEPADIALWQHADKLTEELRSVVREMGPDAYAESERLIAANRGLNEDDPSAHVKFLERAMDNARVTLTEYRAQDEPVTPETDEPAAPAMATAAQKKKLGVLVGRLRDGLNLTTEHLYRAVGHDLIPGDDGELHFGPLLQSLSKAEAHALIDRLERYEASLGVPAS